MKSNAYVAFLRGINVGNHRLKMEHLRELLSVFDIQDIRTYMQSGNVSFKSHITDTAELADAMERHMLELLGYEVPVFIRTIEEFRRTVEESPFNVVEKNADSRHLIMFCADSLDKSINLPAVSSTGQFEILARTGNDLHLLMHVTDNRSGNATAYIEHTFKSPATSRFFHTCKKLIMSENE